MGGALYLSSGLTLVLLGTSFPRAGLRFFQCLDGPESQMEAEA